LKIREVKMIAKKAATVFVFVLIATTPLQAMIIPGRWEKVAAEKPGARIIVSMMTGDRVECTFVSLSPDSLIVSTPDGKEREYSKTIVARITTADKRQDSLANGAGIGALIAGIPAGIIAVQCLAAKTCTGKQVGINFPIYIGIGVGIGLAVDGSVKDYETLYEAPSNASTL
jgi:hypothetical protein